MPQLTLTVNGTTHTLDVAPNRFLAQVLRYDLGLTGTKVGCNEAECGACTVIVNGQSVDSCIYPAFKAQDAQVLTIEGLADRWQQGKNGSVAIDALHPLQEAFIVHGATQCGFCTPGFIMQATTLLDENPAPSDDEIKHCLKDTYCRCTGYKAIVDAVQAAAQKMRTGEMPLPTPPAVMTPLEQIGQPLIRPDAVEKVTGKAIYTDDVSFDDMAYTAVLRSAHAYARILSIDPSDAKQQPGVLAVLTHEDVPGDMRHGLVENDWPVFAGGEYPARYVGDPIAVVVADSEEAAHEALSRIDVQYEVLKPVTDPVTARQPDAPILHPDRPDGNLLKHIKVRHGDPDRGFAEADVIVERTYRTPTTEHAFLEPECSVAVPAGYDDEHRKLTIYVGSQIPYSDRHQVAKSLALQDEQVRIRGMVMGGGFGGKEDITGQIHAAMAAQMTGRPVKLLFTREESLRVHPKRHATIIRVRTGAKRDGTLTAVEAELYGDSGAYASLGEKVMTRATTHATGPYAVPNAKIDCYAMYTNNTPCGAFRGFGVTQSAFAVESNMDILAHELGMDPIELRRKNALHTGSTTATGQELLESVGLLECLQRVEDAIAEEHNQANGDWREPYEANGKRYSWGLAAGYKNTGLGGGAPDKAEAEVEVYPTGRAEIRISSAELGQNLVGVLAACTAEELGLPFNQVSVLVMDTDLAPDGGPTTASRQTYVSGNAARLAARTMREQIQSVLAETYDVPPDAISFHEGLAYVDQERMKELVSQNGGIVGSNGGAGSNGNMNGHNFSMSFGDAVQAMLNEGREASLRYEYWAPKTQPLGTGGDMHFAFSYAVHAALVGVDKDTGEITVEKVITAHDVGRAINPLSLAGQVEGGIVMGMGNALTEHYIVDDGVPWTRHLGQYKMPNIKAMPQMRNFFVEHPTADGPYGAKGVGEISSIPISPAIANAIRNAVGVRSFALPIDQDALLLAMRAGTEEIDARWGDRPAIVALT